MAFFSKKKNKQEHQQQGSGGSASGSAGSPMSPTPGSGPSGPSMYLAGQQQQQQYQPQQPSQGGYAQYTEPHQPQYMHASQQHPQQQPPSSLPSSQIYGGSLPLSNGIVAGASPTPYSTQGVNGPSSAPTANVPYHPQHQQQRSPETAAYPNGIASVPPRPFAGSANGIGQLQASSSNGSMGGSDGLRQPGAGRDGAHPPLHQQQQGSAQGPVPPPSNPVTYPWSQRQISLQPIQAVPSSQPLAQHMAESPSPFPRYGHSVNPLAQSSSGDLYLFGGLVKEQVRNDLFMVSCAAINAQGGSSSDSKVLAQSPINISLVETRGEIPCPRVGHASVSVGNVLIVWGGDTKTREEDPQDDNLYLLNLGSRDWTLVKVTGPSPQGRYGHAATMKGSKFYIFGGQQDVPPGAPDEDAFMNDLWCFDLQNLKAGKPHWTRTEYAQNAPIPPKRTGHTMVHSGECLYIFGGTDGQYHYNDTWCFNTVTSTWSELSCIGYIPVPREGHAATLVDDVVYVFGGRSVDGKDLEDLAAFKISNQRWYMFTNMGPAPSGRSGHAMATWQNKVFVLGGESYTSKKHEWPDMVHMLDTGKIKYPSDSRLGNRKSSNSKMKDAGSTAPPAQQPQPGSVPANKLVQNTVTEEQRRAAASPTGSDRETSRATGLSNSLTKAGPNGASNSPARGAPSPTPRQGQPEASRRPSDTGRRAMSPINEHMQHDAPTRALSPTGQNYFPPSASSQSIPASYSTPPTRTQASMNGASMSPATGVNINALRSNARSPSPSQGPPQQASRSVDSYTQQNQGAQHSRPQQQIPSDELARLQQNNRWMQAALLAAVKGGFMMPEHEDELRGLETERSDSQLVQAVLMLKSELRNIRSSMSEDAKYAEERVAQANKGRNSALQEAAFYRSKVAAMESSSPSDMYKLERGRISDLEQRVVELGGAKGNLEKRVEELEVEVDHHREVAQAAQEREAAHLERAEASDASYSRSLTDFADLQRRAHSNESSLHEHMANVAALESQLAQITSQHATASARLLDYDTSLDQHLRGLEQSKTALMAANDHARKMEDLYNQTQEELAQHQERTMHLETDLRQATHQLSAAQARVDSLEGALETSQREAQSLRDLTTGNMTELLSASRNGGSRERDLGESHSQEVHAVQEELEKHKMMAREAHGRLGTTQDELREAKLHHVSLEKQVTLLRTELAGLRSRHASALEASSRAQALVAQRDLDLRDKGRAIEAAEVRAGLLKSLLAENGLSTEEDGSPSMSSGESSSTTSRKIAELESKLEQRIQAHRELQNLHDDARQDAESSRHRLRMSEEQVDELSSEIEQLKLAASDNAGSSEAASRAEEADRELAELKDKHQQLESTHLKAVQYVKGTEKMFRRMKDELTKYKERNEALEAEVAANKSGSESGHSRKMSSELRPELDNLRTQLAELRQQSEHSNTQNDELQSRIRTLKSEYDTTLSQQQSGHADKVAECQADIDHLQEALDKAQAELEESNSINRQLNTDLQSALNRPQSSGNGNSTRGDEPWAETKQRLEQDLASAMNRSEWLKRENATLEERCRESESKVTLLLDHIESSGGVEAVASSVGHSTNPENDRWQSNGRDSHSEVASDYSHNRDSFQQRQ